MNKKVSIGARPAPRSPQSVDPEAWVQQESRAEPKAAAVPMKRLTIELPADLHTAFKANCVLRGVKMVDEIRRMIEARIAERG